MQATITPGKKPKQASRNLTQETESHTEMDHGIGQQATAFADLRQPIIAHRQFAIDVLPSKGPLHFIAAAIEGSIKPPELPSDGDRRLEGEKVSGTFFLPVWGTARRGSAAEAWTCHNQLARPGRETLQP